MKSNFCQISVDAPFSSSIMKEIGKCASYNGLEKRDEMKLQLLAEEMIGMIPKMTSGYKGRFWLENDGPAYELHIEFHTEFLTIDERDALLSVATSGKNAAATGIVGKIRAAFDVMMASADTPTTMYHGAAFVNEGLYDLDTYSNAWSLERYIQSVEKDELKKGDWDELEKSVVARLADDVIVGIRGRNVELIIKKNIL